MLISSALALVLAAQSGTNVHQIYIRLAVVAPASKLEDTNVLMSIENRSTKTFLIPHYPSLWRGLTWDLKRSSGATLKLVRDQDVPVITDLDLIELAPKKSIQVEISLSDIFLKPNSDFKGRIRFCYDIKNVAVIDQVNRSKVLWGRLCSDWISFSVKRGLVRAEST